ncbi:MAG: hypothetical protein NC084_07590 [Bacteroides sp.]|nr:hypothetical protein [Eubacterium sp.]MCM1417523.1 hypothetical protein [Roseburia sp.]MCM1462558.1 hypothetical protein [Bacteroides sp.]
MDLVIEVKKFTITPRKLDPKKIYTFQNDAEIDHLSEQLRTIRDFHFTSREQMYAKAEELKRGIGERTAENPQESQLQLKRVAELIAVYEKIVEGNYINNLIREQKDREQTRAVEKRV